MLQTISYDEVELKHQIFLDIAKLIQFIGKLTSEHNKVPVNSQ